MPRPAPPEPLKPRQVRLSDTEWTLFKAAGGAEWLRRRLKSAGLKRQHITRERNRRIRIDAAILSEPQLADKYHLTPSAIRKILRETPNNGRNHL